MSIVLDLVSWSWDYLRSGGACVRIVDHSLRVDIVSEANGWNVCLREMLWVYGGGFSLLGSQEIQW